MIAEVPEYRPIPPRPEAVGDWRWIDGEEAHRLLGSNIGNRNVRNLAVETLARDINSGDFAANGETIKISASNVLLDGQHRLLAIIESGFGAWCYVIEGLPDEARESIDIGIKRNYADLLLNEPNAHQLAAAIRVAWTIQTHGRTKAYGVTASHAELRDWFLANPDVRNSVQTGNAIRKTALRYTPSIAIALHYLMGLLDGDQADDFWDDLSHGRARPGSPLFALRETLLRDLSSPHRKMGPEPRAAITIKAWNYLREGRDNVKVIGWRRSGRAPEPFPTIK